MATLDLIEHWDEIEEQPSFEPLPAGTYDVEIVSSDAQYAEKAQGIRVEVTYRVITGPFEGRQGWDRFDVQRHSEWTDKRTGERRSGYIDGARFKTLCSALGLENQPTDTTEMHGIPFKAKVSYRDNPDPSKDPFASWGSYKRTEIGHQPAPARQQQAPRPVASAAPAAKPAPARAGLPPAFMNRAAQTPR